MKKKGLGDHQRFQYLHCGFAFSALVACFVRCVFRVFPCVSLCVRPSVTSRDLYTMLFPISFQWTPPHPPRSPRMHCGFPEAFASTVHQTIPANFRVCFPMRLCSLPRTPRGFCYTLPRTFSHGLLFRPFTASPLPHVSHISL